MESIGNLEELLGLNITGVEREKLTLLDVQNRHRDAMFATEVLDIVYDNTRLKTINHLTRPAISLNRGSKRSGDKGLLAVQLATPVLERGFFRKDLCYTTIADIVDGEPTEIYNDFNSRQVITCLNLARELIALSETKLPHLSNDLTFIADGKKKR
jgi:hypothetical protein